MSSSSDPNPQWRIAVDNGSVVFHHTQHDLELMGAYFQKLLSSKMKECETKSIIFPDISATEWAIFSSVCKDPDHLCLLSSRQMVPLFVLIDRFETEILPGWGRIIASQIVNELTPLRSTMMFMSRAWNMFEATFRTTFPATRLQ